MIELCNGKGTFQTRTLQMDYFYLNTNVLFYDLHTPIYTLSEHVINQIKLDILPVYE